MYETQIMIELAKGAMKLHGNLKEVLFLENDNKDSILIFSDGTELPAAHHLHRFDIRCEAYAFPLAARLGGTDPFSLLLFGYTGSGPECYAAFLDAAGFVDTNVKEEVKAPLKLTRNGRRISGTRRQAQWAKEFSGKSFEEAKKKIEPPEYADACILREEVLCDGSAATMVVTVNTTSSDEAEKKARFELPSSSEVLSVEISDKKASESKEILASTVAEATERARGMIWNPTLKELVGISCTRKERRGLLGIGKRSGVWEALFDLKQKEVTFRYVPPVKIKVHYGPKKLLCNRCGLVMNTSIEGVFTIGASPKAKPPLLKLRCEKCDITRFEKHMEIEGEWIAWEDGTTTPL